MQKSEQKSNKREAVRTEMQKMRRKSFYFFLPVILVIFYGLLHLCVQKNNS